MLRLHYVLHLPSFIKIKAKHMLKHPVVMGSSVNVQKSVVAVSSFTELKRAQGDALIPYRRSVIMANQRVCAAAYQLKKAPTQPWCTWSSVVWEVVQTSGYNLWIILDQKTRNVETIDVLNTLIYFSLTAGARIVDIPQPQYC